MRSICPLKARILCALIELLVVEYADKKEDTQLLLKPMTVALLMHVAREYRRAAVPGASLSLSERIIQYISAHLEHITLGMLSTRFSYHPNYVSTLLHREMGKTFSEILLELRMERALALLKGTDLSVEEISAMTGYNNTSNFYRAFRGYCHVSPREYIYRECRKAGSLP